MTEAAVSLTPAEAAFGDALDDAIRQTAGDVAAAQDEILVGATAMGFELLSEGATVDAATFLRLHHEVGQELATVIAEDGGGEERRKYLGIAVSRVATKMRGEVLIPLKGKK